MVKFETEAIFDMGHTSIAQLSDFIGGVFKEAIHGVYISLAEQKIQGLRKDCKIVYKSRMKPSLHFWIILALLVSALSGACREVSPGPEPVATKAGIQARVVTVDWMHDGRSIRASGDQMFFEPGKESFRLQGNTVVKLKGLSPGTAAWSVSAGQVDVNSRQGAISFEGQVRATFFSPTMLGSPMIDDTHD